MTAIMIWERDSIMSIDDTPLISPGCSLEGLMLNLKLQYFGLLMRRSDSFKKPWCWERLRAGGEGDDRGWDGWMASSTWWTWVWVGSGSWWWTGRPGVLQFMRLQRFRHYWPTELNWSKPGKMCFQDLEITFREFKLVAQDHWRITVSYTVSSSILEH